MQREWRFQNAAYAYLRKALPADALVWGTDHAGKRSPAAGARMKQRGIIPGIPDLFVLYKRTLIGLELKAGRNTATDAQEAFGAAIRRNGGAFHVITTIEQIEALLRDLQIPLRATTLTAAERDAFLAVERAPSKAKPRIEKPSRARVARVMRVMAATYRRPD